MQRRNGQIPDTTNDVQPVSSIPILSVIPFSMHYAPYSERTTTIITPSQSLPTDNFGSSLGNSPNTASKKRHREAESNPSNKKPRKTQQTESEKETNQYNKLRLKFQNGEKVSKEVFKTLQEEGKGKNIKRFVTIDGVKVEVFTDDQLRKNCLQFEGGKRVSGAELETLSIEYTQNGIRRYVTVEDAKIEVFKPNQLNNHRIYFADEVQVPKEALHTLEIEKKGREIKRHVTVNGIRKEAFTYAQLRKNHLKFADGKDVPDAILETLSTKKMEIKHNAMLPLMVLRNNFLHLINLEVSKQKS